MIVFRERSVDPAWRPLPHPKSPQCAGTGTGKLWSSDLRALMLAVVPVPAHLSRPTRGVANYRAAGALRADSIARRQGPGGCLGYPASH